MRARIHVCVVLTAALILATSCLSAQNVAPLHPFGNTGDMLVTDSSSDSIWKMQDLNMDGDYLDSAEVTLFYDDLFPGAIVLNVNSDVIVAADGTAYVCDTGDYVVALRDFNGDGDAMDTGEFWIFFHGTSGGNAGGIDMLSPMGLTVDAAGVVYVANASTGGGGFDVVVRLQDLNADNDADDAAEAVIYANMSGTPNSLPSDVAIGPDGHVYFTDEHATGGEGVYRCTDANSDGDCTDPLDSVLPYFIPPPQALLPWPWGLAFDSSGAFPSGVLYMTDTRNEIIYRCEDADGNNQIDPGEETIWWQGLVSSTNWKVDVASDGSVYAVEDQTPDRIIHLVDANGDGVIDPILGNGEYMEVYDETISSVPLGSSRGLCFMRAPTLRMPSTVALGGPFTTSLDGAGGDFYSLWISTALVQPSWFLPPLGILDINVLPVAPDFAFEWLNGFIPAGGTLSLPLVMPSVPGLVGTYHLQFLGGPLSRLQFSNLITLNITL